MHHLESTGDPVRVTEAEAQDLVQRYLGAQTVEEGVDLRSIAAALRISEEEVVRLLAVARAEKQEKLRRRKSVWWRFRDSTAAFAAGLFLLLIFGFLLAWGLSGDGRFSIPPRASVQGKSLYIATESFGVQVGSTNDNIPVRMNALQLSGSEELVEAIHSRVEQVVDEQYSTSTTLGMRLAERSLILAMEGGDYSSPHLLTTSLALSTGIGGVLASNVKLPVYTGTNREIQDWLVNERRKRVAQSLQMIERSARLRAGALQG